MQNAIPKQKEKLLTKDWELQGYEYEIVLQTTINNGKENVGFHFCCVPTHKRVNDPIVEHIRTGVDSIEQDWKNDNNDEHLIQM